ncbi:dipeptidase [Thermodesulfobacteriota bacterium]
MNVKDIFKESDIAKKERAKTEGRLYVDCHVDLPYYMMKYAPDLKLSQVKDAPFTIEKAGACGVRLFCTAIYCDDRYNGKKSLEHFEKIYGFVEDSFDEIKIVRNHGELYELNDHPELIAAVLLLENADFLAGDSKHTAELKKMGIGIVGLTHAGKNRLADGNSVVYPDGITKKGEEIISQLNMERVLIDVAHLHEKCFWQLLRMVERPVISSHTGIREVLNIPRNLYLEQAGEIVQRGGMIGITFNPEMLAGPGRFGVDQVFVHMDTFVQKFGPDFIGLGSDFCGFDETLADAEDITGIENLIDIMLSAGYGKRAVDKIMGENWHRLFEKYLLI